MKVSVIIPTYNSERKIKPTLEKLSKVKKRKQIHEIIVVNDGSTDKTAEVSSKYARVVSLEQNQGKGAAMRVGALKAKGDVLVFIDDSQFDPYEIPKLIEKMKETGASMVIGDRDFSLVPWCRRVTNTLSKLAILMGTGKRINDAISGFRAIRKKHFNSLKTKEDRYSIEAEINFRSLLKGIKVEEVPITVSYKETSALSSSSFRTWKFVIDESLYNAKTVLKIWFGLFK